jgi:hypothetical protein
MRKDDFKVYLLRKLWREQDLDLQAALDDLLLEVNSRINRDILMDADIKYIEVTPSMHVQNYSNAAIFKIPDLYRVSSVYSPDRNCPMYKVNLDRVIAKEPVIDGYSVVSQDVILVAERDWLPSAKSLKVWYYTAIEPFFDPVPIGGGGNPFTYDPNSFQNSFTSRHLDFYTLAAMAHITDTWLRDNEWADRLEAKYAASVDAVRVAEHYRAFGAGGTLDMPVPGVVA